MFVAQMDTEHFDFVAVGETELQAREAILGGFRAHLMSHSDFHMAEEADVDDYIVNGIGDGTGDDPAAALDEYYGIRVVELQAGEAARDWTQVFPAETAERYWTKFRAEAGLTDGV